MTRSEKAMVERNLDLIFEFQKYVLEHPAIAEDIPNEAVVVLQVKGDAAFNRWSRRLGEKAAKTEGRQVVHVTIRKMEPPRSRIKDLEVEQAA